MDEFPKFQHKPEKKPNFKQRVAAGLQSGRINPISDRKKKQLKEYRKAIANEVEQPCCKCGSKYILTRHHYKGQQFITEYIILCQTCHNWCHENGHEATRLGWLWPEYRGLQPNPQQLIPWKQNDTK